MGLIETAVAFLVKRIASKGLDKLENKALENIFIIETLDKFGLLERKPKPDPVSIYVHALIEYAGEAEFHLQGFVKLFGIKSVQRAFLDGIYFDNPDKTDLQIREVFQTHKKLTDLREYYPNKEDLYAAIALFAGLYDDLTIRTAKPFQIKRYYDSLHERREIMKNQLKMIRDHEDFRASFASMKEELDEVKDRMTKKSFDYQIRQYLENHIITPFQTKYLSTDRYVPLRGHQIRQQSFKNKRFSLGDLDNSLIRDNQVRSHEDVDGDGGESIHRADGEKLRKQESPKIKFNPLERYFQTVFNATNLDRYRFVVMLGEYGTGKSTFFSFLAYALASNHLDSGGKLTVHDPRKRIPILIPLREYNGEPFERFVVSHLNEFEVEDFNRGKLRAKLRNGDFILLLDGFDEMISREAETRKKYHAELLKDLLPSEGDTGSLILLSSRKEYFKGTQERDSIFGIANSDSKVKAEFIHLDTFTDSQIREFLEKNKEEGQDVNKLWGHITTIFDLKDLAKRAVLLELIIKYLPHLIRKKKKPREAIRSVELYQEVFKKEIQRVKKEKFGGKAFLGSLDKQRQLLRNLALDLNLRNELVFTYQEAESALQKVMNYGPETQERTREADLTKFLTFSFLLNDGENTYRFSHKSFRDFLIAEAHHQEIEKEEVKEFGQRLNTDEITTFLAELQPDPEKLRQLLNNSANLPEQKQYQGSNALKVLLAMDREWLADNSIYNAELTEVDFTRAKLTDCTFTDTSLTDCTWDMNMFELNLRNCTVRRGGGHYWGADYLKLDFEESKKRRASYKWVIAPELERIARWTGVEALDLSDTEVSDLGPLQYLQNLNLLNLYGTQVSDLGPLQHLLNLNSLDLSVTQVSDLGPLQDLLNLKKIVISYAQKEADHWKAFAAARPDVRLSSY
ncbi:MAG: NACHT domain-containing protein [Bacteroidota bacterium]